MEYPVVIQLLQVIREPFVPDRQQSEEGGLSCTLTAHQTKHFLIFGTGTEYPAYSTQQEMFQHFFHIVTFISTKKMVQTGSDAWCTVPDKAVQHILNWMVTIFVCYDRKGSRDLFLTGQLIVSLKIEEKIFHIRIRQSAGIPAPAQVLYNVYPVCQEIKPDGIPQEWIAAEHNPAVVDGVGCFSLVGNRKALPHLINALFRRYGFGCAHHSLLGGWR